MPSISPVSHTPIQSAHIPDTPPAAAKPQLTRSESLPASPGPAITKPFERSNSSAAMLATRILGDGLGSVPNMPFKSLELTKADLREMAKVVNGLPMPPQAAAEDGASTSDPLRAHVQHNADVTKKRLQQAALVRADLEVNGESMRSSGSILRGSALDAEHGSAYLQFDALIEQHKNDSHTLPQPSPEHDASSLFHQDTRRSDAPSTPLHGNGAAAVDAGPIDTAIAMPSDPARKAEVLRLLNDIPAWRAALVTGHAGINLLTNGVISMVRDGTITALATYTRELVGHAISNNDWTEESKQKVAYGILTATAGLNMASMLLHRSKGTQNKVTEICNGLNVAAMAGMMGLLAGTNGGKGATGAKAAAADAAALLLKSAAYVTTRDTLNYVFPMVDMMDDGASPPFMAGVLGSVPYGAISTGVNYLQGVEGVFSGTGGGKDLKAGSSALNEGLMKFAAANALGETLDGLKIPYEAALTKGRVGVDIDGVQRGGKKDVVLMPSLRPFYQKPEEGVPADSFPTAAKKYASGYLDKVLGSMTKRLTAMGLGSVVSVAMNHSMAIAGLTKGERDAVFNVGSAALQLAYYSVFSGSLLESPAPAPDPAPERHPPRGDEAV